jgi:hypothetical protein
MNCGLIVQPNQFSLYVMQLLQTFIPRVVAWRDDRPTDFLLQPPRVTAASLLSALRHPIPPPYLPTKRSRANLNQPDLRNAKPVGSQSTKPPKSGETAIAVLSSLSAPGVAIISSSLKRLVGPLKRSSWNCKTPIVSQTTL